MTRNVSRSGDRLFNVDLEVFDCSSGLVIATKGTEMEKMQTAATVLIVSGLRERVAGHWQTLLTACLAKVRSVPPLATNKFRCAAWIEVVQCGLAEIDGPVILVVHSAGVMMVAHWAVRHRHVTKLNGPLPLPCTVVASSNDYLASLEAVTRMAKGGSQLANLGAVGYLKPGC
jgi:predicted alpha/beta hydrolase family esterase